MPIVPSVTVAPPAAPAAPAVPAVPDRPAVDFDAALSAASRGGAGSSAPSVPLGVMLQALAGAPSSTPPVAAAPPAAAAVGGLRGASPVAPVAGAEGGAVGAKVIAAAEQYLGVPYLWGGTDPAKGLDCSGFVQRVYEDLGVKLPRVSVDQSKAGTAVESLEQARPGDLVFWNGDGSRPNHIGIYAGEGQMIVAPRTGDVVKYQDITRTPHEIRRVV